MIDYQAIKTFLSQGGKVLLVEEGRPAMVVLTYGEYEALSQGASLTSRVLPHNAPDVQSGAFQELTIEDLPV